MTACEKMPKGGLLWPFSHKVVFLLSLGENTELPTFSATGGFHSALEGTVSPAFSATVIIIVTVIISGSAYLCFLKYICTGCCKSFQVVPLRRPERSKSEEQVWLGGPSTAEDPVKKNWFPDNWRKKNSKSDPERVNFWIEMWFYFLVAIRRTSKGATLKNGGKAFSVTLRRSEGGAFGFFCPPRTHCFMTKESER